MGRCRSVLWVFVDWCRFFERGSVNFVGFCVLEVVVMGTVGLMGFFFWWLRQGGGCLRGFRWWLGLAAVVDLAAVVVDLSLCLVWVSLSMILVVVDGGGGCGLWG